MKKRISKLLILILVISSFAAIFTGCNITIGASFDYEFTANNTATIKFYNDNSTVSEITVPDDVDGIPVTRIDDFGICDSNYLKKLKIGKNVSEIGDIGIKNNALLEEFIVDPDNQYFKAIDGVLYTIDGKELISYPTRKNLKTREKLDDKGQVVKNKVTGKIQIEEYIVEYKIAEGCEIIRPYSIYHIRALEKIIMPDSVKFIGEAAMLMDSGMLKEVVLSKNLLTISKDAFSKNMGLKNITIHSKIQKIETYAFFGCPSLTVINVCRAEADIDLQARWKPSAKGTEITAFNPKKHKEADRAKYLTLTYAYNCETGC